MKQFILFFFLTITFVRNYAFSQNNLGKSDDVARLSLNIYIPEQAEAVSEIAQSLLQDKIARILTEYSITGSNAYERFIVVPVISVLDKEVTSTAPSMVVLSLQITLYIGDGFQGIKFASTSFNSKGVGQNESKAYMSAIKNIKINEAGVKNFIENGKNKIIEYYNSMCDFNIKKSNTLAGQNKFDEAMYLLASVPEVAKSCYDKSMDAVLPIFKKAIDLKCEQALSRAKNIWNSSQDADAAYKVARELSDIDPNASCIGEVNKFTSMVKQRVFELEKREWEFKLKQQQDIVDIRKAQIRASRDIGVAYGNNQPKTVYNTTLIRSWWW